MNKHMAIVLAQKEFSNATPLRQLLYRYNFTMHYTESIDQFINIFTKANEGFIFVDSQFYRFALLLKNAVEKVDIFKKYTIIFFGENDNCRESLENNINIFSCHSDKILELTRKLLSGYARRKRQENMSSKSVMPEDSIKEFLQSFGFSPKYKGFKYMVTAIRLGSLRPITNLRKEVYERLVKAYNTSLPSVERDIRVLFTTAVNQTYLCSLLRTFLGFKPERLTTKNFVLIMTEIYRSRGRTANLSLAKSLLYEMKEMELDKITNAQEIG